MKIFLSFLCGFLAGIFASVLLYKLGFGNGKIAPSALSRIRSSSRLSKNIKVSEKGRRWFQHPIAYVAAGSILILLSVPAYRYSRPGDAVRPEPLSSRDRKVLSPVPGEEGKSNLTKETPEIEPPVPGESDRPQTEPKASPEKEKTRSSPSFPYSIKLDAFRTLEMAQKSVRMYAERGISPYWVKVDLGDDGTWYRIYTGQFSDPEKAEEYRQRHRLKDSRVLKTQYANLIGVYTSRSEMEEKVLTLKTLGYSPYVLEEPAGKFRLFVGAFLTKEGVEKQQNDLKSNNVNSQIVDR